MSFEKKIGRKISEQISKNPDVFEKFDIFLKTKFNLENLICDGSLSLIGYAAV